jgi:hypothetical protein
VKRFGSPKAAWKRPAKRQRRLKNKLAVDLAARELMALLERFTDIFSDRDFTVIDPQVKATIRVGANPSLVHD